MKQPVPPNSGWEEDEDDTAPEQPWRQRIGRVVAGSSVVNPSNNNIGDIESDNHHDSHNNQSINNSKNRNSSIKAAIGTFFASPNRAPDDIDDIDHTDALVAIVAHPVSPPLLIRQRRANVVAAVDVGETTTATAVTLTAPPCDTMSPPLIWGQRRVGLTYRDICDSHLGSSSSLLDVHQLPMKGGMAKRHRVRRTRQLRRNSGSSSSRLYGNIAGCCWRILIAAIALVVVVALVLVLVQEILVLHAKSSVSPFDSETQQAPPWTKPADSAHWAVFYNIYIAPQSRWVPPPLASFSRQHGQLLIAEQLGQVGRSYAASAGDLRVMQSGSNPCVRRSNSTRWSAYTWRTTMPPTK
jgi:hypothetical protein